MNRGLATYQSQYSQSTGAILAFTALAAVPALGVLMFAGDIWRRALRARFRGK